MYVDKLDGLIETAFFERMSNRWREEQNRCQREIERHQNADKSYKDEGIALLDLARNAQRLFAAQEPREKRRLLNFLLSNCTWEDGEVVATFREPFDTLAETAANSNRLETGVTFKAAKTEIWLAAFRRNRWPPSIGTHGRVQSESLAAIPGIRILAFDASARSHYGDFLGAEIVPMPAHNFWAAIGGNKFVIEKKQPLKF